MRGNWPARLFGLLLVVGSVGTLLLVFMVAAARLLPQVVTTSAVVTVAYPLDVVQRLVANPGNAAAWRKDLQSVEPRGPGAWEELGTHGERTAVSLHQPQPDAGLALRLRDDAHGWEATREVRLEATPAGTRVTVTQTTLHLHLIPRFAAVALRGDEDTLKRWLLDLDAGLAASTRVP